MPVAYLRIVCAKIAGTGKFSVQQIFSFNGEKFLCANFFTEKQINEPAERKNSPEKNAAVRRKTWEMSAPVNQLSACTQLEQSGNIKLRHRISSLSHRETDVKRVQAHPPFYGNRPRRQQEGHLRDQQD